MARRRRWTPVAGPARDRPLHPISAPLCQTLGLREPTWVGERPRRTPGKPSGHPASVRRNSPASRTGGDADRATRTDDGDPALPGPAHPCPSLPNSDHGGPDQRGGACLRTTCWSHERTVSPSLPVGVGRQDTHTLLDSGSMVTLVRPRLTDGIPEISRWAASTAKPRHIARTASPYSPRRGPSRSRLGWTRRPVRRCPAGRRRPQKCLGTRAGPRGHITGLGGCPAVPTF